MIVQSDTAYSKNQLLSERTQHAFCGVPGPSCAHPSAKPHGTAAPLSSRPSSGAANPVLSAPFVAPPRCWRGPGTPQCLRGWGPCPGGTGEGGGGAVAPEGAAPGPIPAAGGRASAQLAGCGSVVGQRQLLRCAGKSNQTIVGQSWATVLKGGRRFSTRIMVCIKVRGSGTWFRAFQRSCGRRC